jgi:hypothetical protein
LKNSSTPAKPSVIDASPIGFRGFFILEEFMEKLELCLRRIKQLRDLDEALKFERDELSRCAIGDWAVDFDDKRSRIILLKSNVRGKISKLHDKIYALRESNTYRMMRKGLEHKAYLLKQPYTKEISEVVACIDLLLERISNGKHS